MEIIDPYDPCPCGSGKKYKFCCYQKKPVDDKPHVVGYSSNYNDEIYTSLQNEKGYAESIYQCQKGLQLIRQGDLEEAITHFRKANNALPIMYTAANNLADCLLNVGNLDEAIRVQHKSLQVSHLPNPFGLANMATFLFIKGDEIGCRRNLEEALKLRMPSADACVKVCEVLARFKRHQQIIELVDACDFDDAAGIYFFSGVASANLNDFDRAQQDLERVLKNFYKNDLVRNYLQNIKEGIRPKTIREDWPYLRSPEVCPFMLISNGMEEDIDTWYKRRVTVDFAEAALNESAHAPQHIFEVLANIKHPEAVHLLWLIAEGSFGPDTLRMNAAQELLNRGEITADKPITMLIGGKRKEVLLGGMKLNPNYRYGGELSGKLGKQYEKAVKDSSTKKNVDWEKMSQTFLDIVKEAPDYPPALFNYIFTLLKRKRHDEALPILRELTKKHPSYLFARGTLLELLLLLKLDDEADVLVKSTVLPQETHPSAVATWFCAMTLYHEKAERFEEAYSSIRSAHGIAPQMASVKKLWKNYKAWGDEDLDQ